MWDIVNTIYISTQCNETVFYCVVIVEYLSINLSIVSLWNTTWPCVAYSSSTDHRTVELRRPYSSVCSLWGSSVLLTDVKVDMRLILMFTASPFSLVQPILCCMTKSKSTKRFHSNKVSADMVLQLWDD